MRYRVEYLVESTEEQTVCASKEAEGDLQTVEWQARLGGPEARLKHGADGFQIRDLTDAGRIVALESFDEPLSVFTAHPRDYVIH